MRALFTVVFNLVFTPVLAASQRNPRIGQSSMRLLTLLSFSFLLMACSGLRGNYNNYLLKFNGYTQEELNEVFGKPTSTERVDSATVKLVYKTTHQELIEVQPAVYEKVEGADKPRLVRTTQYAQVPQFCESSFLLGDGYVVMWGAVGKCLTPKQLESMQTENQARLEALKEQEKLLKEGAAPPRHAVTPASK